ncbi:glutathione S-transferase [Amanita muscaria]
MVLKLYGTPRANWTVLVGAVLYETNVPFELVLVDMVKKKEHKLPELKGLTRIKIQDDDGFILYESRAISRYIIAKHGGQGPELIPKDLKKNALFEQAASSEAANFSPSALAIFFEKVIKNYIGQEIDEVAVEKHRSTLDGKLEGYERILGKQKYIAGDEFTLADLFHLPCGAFLSVAGSGDLIEKRPNVKRWLDDICSRASWQAVTKDGVQSRTV